MLQNELENTQYKELKQEKNWGNKKYCICGVVIINIVLFIMGVLIITNTNKILSTLGFYSSINCPFTSWVYCAQEDGTCNIPSNILYTTIAYGLNGKWTFQNYSNYYPSVWGSYNLKVGCNNDAYGDVSPGGDKICCYDPSTTGTQTWSSLLWTSIGAEGSHILRPNGIYLVAYGAKWVYTYRYVEGAFTCDNNYFGDPIPGIDKNCYALNNGTTSPIWISCGSESGGICNLKVDTTNTNAKRLVKYGASINGITQYNYRRVSSSNGDVPCNNNFFDDPFSGQDKFCYVSSISSSNVY